MKIYLLVLLATLNIINNTDVAVDMLAVPNECSSLGGILLLQKIVKFMNLPKNIVVCLQLHINLMIVMM